ncbi:plasmid partitioning protein RepB [Rhizobium sp. RAF56]|uniref:plasmid partitioning protein RepB n=1 Tax=Rhizobium sp. RAF56 TaxID=3233062 RepID=UPI003F9AF48D
MSRKDSKGLFANVFSTPATVQTEAPAAMRTSSPHLAKVAAGLRTIQERGELAERMLRDGGGVIELDPTLVDPSPYPDRLRDAADSSSFEDFKETIATEGQQVPVQVRPHPTEPGRFQMVYGHRRLRAARELGLLVRALVREMDDRDLVKAQGIENGQRQDLTWIERALFAFRMEGADVKARDIKAALSIDDTEMAKMRLVTRSVPTEIIEAIGRAPKVGRPRWIAFAKGLNERSAIATVRKTLAAAKVSSASSDDRFGLAVESLKTPATPRGRPQALQDVSGRPLGRLVVSKTEIRVVAENSDGEAFARFLHDELPRLIERFSAKR